MLNNYQDFGNKNDVTIDDGIDLSDEALEIAAGNNFEMGASPTSTDWTLCGCKKSASK
jgi:hypothetical protein